MPRKVSAPAAPTPNAEQIAGAIKKLTDYRSEISRQSPYQTAELMIRLSRRMPRLVRTAVAEAADAQTQLARAIASAFREDSSTK